MSLLPFPVYFLVPSSILIIIVGLYSWLRVKKRENLLFFLLAICQAVWAVCTFLMWKSCGNDAQVIFWDRTLYFATAFMVPLLFHFTVEACGVSGTKANKVLIPWGYILGLFFSYLSATPYFVNYVFYYKWGCHTYAQIGHHFFFAYVIFFCSVALANVFKVWVGEKKDKEKKTKASFIFIAFLVFTLSAVGMLLAYGIALYPFSYLCFPIFSVIITYAITERNLFMSVVATDVLVATILTLNATLFFFPEIELSFWAKGVISLLLIASCVLLVKHNHEEIKRKEELERISKLKTEFISIVSHQLRTPLAAIRGYTDMLEDGDYGEIPPRIAEPIKYIHDSTVSMIKMVNGLLSVSRLERGKIELKLQKFSILDLIEQCIRDLELSAEKKGLYLKYVKPKGKISLVRGDPEKIKQAVSNVLSNAILYTFKGGVTVSVSEMSSFVRIEIKDTGVGIEKEELEKIFLSFSRGKRGVEIYAQGTGLGLYVARSFIEMHKGKITAFSEGKDKGSVFYIDIPIRADIESRQEFKLVPGDTKQ
jgi:signal transduction histidine kinase